MVDSVSIKPCYRSYPCTVLLKSKFNKFLRGHGLWKFSNSLLTDYTYILKRLNNFLKVQDQYLHDDDINHNIFLEVLLMKIRVVLPFHILHLCAKKAIKLKYI